MLSGRTITQTGDMNVVQAVDTLGSMGTRTTAVPRQRQPTRVEVDVDVADITGQWAM